MNGSPSDLLAGIPAELRERKQWLVHRDKQPYRALPPRERASVTDPATWASYDDAVAAKAAFAGAAARNPKLYRPFDGIGFVFSANDPFVGVDLDRCVTAGEIHPAAAELITRLNGYTEV